MNLVIIASAKTKPVRLLIDGFFASKGFRPLLNKEGSPSNFRLPAMMIVDHPDKLVDGIKVAKAVASKDTRIIILSCDKKKLNKKRMADATYFASTAKTGVEFYMELERVIKAEKEISRGSKPKWTIKVPVKL